MELTKNITENKTQHKKPIDCFKHQVTSLHLSRKHNEKKICTKNIVRKKTKNLF